jgi:hypothetical protein
MIHRKYDLFLQTQNLLVRMEAEVRGSGVMRFSSLYKGPKGFKRLESTVVVRWIGF